MSNNFVYQIRNSLYLNLTNRCPNRCDFCIRFYTDGLGGVRLVLDREPEFRDLVAQITPRLDSVNEVVFCGFGEPACRIELVAAVAGWLRGVFSGGIRLNTNGLGNLIHERNILPELSGLIDCISISLNATNAEEYDSICHPEFGLDAYPAILEFIRDAKHHIPKVVVSAVDSSGADMEHIEEIADELGVEFRIR